VGDRPGQLGADEAVLAAVGQAAGLHPGSDRLLPVVVVPQGGVVLAAGVLQGERVVHLVVGLLAAVHFGRPDARIGIVGAAAHFVDLHGLARVDLVADHLVGGNAIEPAVFGDDVRIPHPCAFLRVESAPPCAVLAHERLAVRPHDGGLGPVPAQFGADVVASVFGDVAGLAGDFFRVLVEPGHLFRVRLVAVAGLASGGIAGVYLAANVCRPFDCRRHVVAATGDLVARRGVAGGATEVEPLLVHVHIQILARMLQRTVEVAVLRAVGAGTEEMAGAAVGAAGLADVLGQFLQIDGIDELA